MKPCNICGDELRNKKTKNIIYADGLVEEVYSETCNNCEQLLYGSVKPIGWVDNEGNFAS